VGEGLSLTQGEESMEEGGSILRILAICLKPLTSSGLLQGRSPSYFKGEIIVLEGFRITGNL
jgi:hypothetical protein